MERWSTKAELRAMSRRHTQGIYQGGCKFKSPLKIRGIAGESFEYECGHCLYCLTKKQSALEFYAKKELYTEYMKGNGASFITLTYTEENLPYAVKKTWVEGETQHKIYTRNELGEKIENEEYCVVRPGELKKDISIIKTLKDGINTLYRPDFQKFMKNMRRQMEYNKYKKNFKMLYCGEYGDQTLRSHMHLILIGMGSEEAKIFTKKCWKYGMIDIGPLTRGGIRYLVDYISKSQMTRKMKEIINKKGVQAPWIYHSIGMGKQWLMENMEQLINDDFFYIGNRGQKTMLPKRAIKWICKQKDINYLDYYERKARERKTPTETLIEQRTLKELNQYEAKRQKMQEPIDPNYLWQLQQVDKAHMRHKRYQPGYKDRNQYVKQIMNLDKLEEQINFENLCNFFENIA